MSDIHSPREPCTGGGSSSIEHRDGFGGRMVAHTDDETFHRNSPRPPVPGEENETRCLGVESIDIGDGYESPSSKEWTSKHCKPSLGLPIGSPCHTPCHRASSSSPFLRAHRLAATVTDATTAHPDEASQALDPEHSGPRSASSSSNSLPDSSGTPPYLRWAQNLRSLLEDPDGVELFRRYLEGERCADTLSFWFACEGLKKQPNDDPGRIAQLIKVIHRKFFPRAVLAVPEEMRREVARRIRESTTSSTAPATSATSPLTPPDAIATVITPPLATPLPSNQPDCHVFDSVQREVERHINETTYPNFLRSDLYLHHVQCMQSGVGSGGPGGTIPGGGGSGSSSGSSCGGGEEGALVGPIVTGPLPTVHEDSELVTGGESAQCSTSGGNSSSQLDPLLPLTRDMLLVTQNSRALELRPKPEAYAGLYLRQQGMLPSPYHHHHHHLASPTPPTPSHHSRHHRLLHPHASHIPTHLLQPPAPHPHLQYSSYNPVSRQDSELQSLSSDAHTDDTMSLTDSSVDGMSMGGSHHRLSKKQYIRHCKQIKESANLNRDPCMHHTVIPRTQRIQKEQVHPMKPEEFAAILIDKLETVKRKQEAQEKLDRKLQEGEGASGTEDSCGVTENMACFGGFGGGIMSVASPRTLADAIREKLQLTTDDSDQAILDQHVSRVWSDLTPSRSPGALSSPRPRSPDGSGRKRGAASAMPGSWLPSVAISSHSSATGLTSVPGGSGTGISLLPPNPYQARLSYCPRHSRKEKDVFSTFSSDSGNVHDFPSDAGGGGGSLSALGPPSDLSLGTAAMGRQQQQSSLQQHHYLPKSKSVPDYAEAQKGQDLLYSPVPGVHDGRFTRPGKEVDRRRSSSSKKTLTELTDSGVSVVSDTPTSTLHAPSTSTHSKERVLSWLLESEKQSSCGGGGGGSHSHTSDRDSSSKHRIRSSTCATSPISSRRGKKSVVVYNSSSRSGSLERASGSGSAAPNAGICSSGVSGGGWGGGHSPAQPFVADPCMPPLPLPHTPTQLEEARRRLEDDFRPRNSAGGSISVPQGPLPRQRFSSSGKASHMEAIGGSSGTAITSISNPSTLRKGRSTSRGSGAGIGPPLPSGEGSAGPEYTTVVFSFCDEQFPYRTKIPGRQLTLKHFKEYLPKKGSYRYFFKTECEDLDMKVIQEEIMDDNEILPLWEGKVMAQVKPID